MKRSRDSEKTDVENTGTRPVGSPGGSWWQSARNAEVDGDKLTAELQTADGRDWPKSTVTFKDGETFVNDDGRFLKTESYITCKVYHATL